VSPGHPLCSVFQGVKLTLLGTPSHKAYQRVRDGNFLLEGLVGINIKGKTVGLIGTGRIGLCVGKILAHGFGAEVIAYDPYPAKDAASYGITYAKDLDELLTRSDIISIHCPLLESTKYIINENTISKMKDGVFLVNTSRGGLIDTGALIKGLKAGKFWGCRPRCLRKGAGVFLQGLERDRYSG
jgi:D-lactate dehydrogenase